MRVKATDKGREGWKTNGYVDTTKHEVERNIRRRKKSVCICVYVRYVTFMSQ